MTERAPSPPNSRPPLEGGPFFLYWQPGDPVRYHFGDTQSESARRSAPHAARLNRSPRNALVRNRVMRKLIVVATIAASLVTSARAETFFVLTSTAAHTGIGCYEITEPDAQAVVALFAKLFGPAVKWDALSAGVIATYQGAVVEALFNRADCAVAQAHLTALGWSFIPPFPRSQQR